METQAFFENIQAQIQTRLLAAEKEIDLAVAWFTDRLLFETVCQKAKKGVTVRLLLFDDDINQYSFSFKCSTKDRQLLVADSSPPTPYFARF